MAEPEDESLLIPMQLQNNRTSLIRNQNKNKSNMRWQMTRDQRILWTEETHLFLIKSIRANWAVLGSETKPDVREQAWQQIYKAMEKLGMPSCTMGALHRTWGRIKSKAVENIKRYRKQKSNRVKNIAPLSRKDQAILELLNHFKVVSKNKITPGKSLDALQAILPRSPRKSLPSRSPKKSSPKSSRLRRRALSMYVDRNNTLDKSAESLATEPIDQNEPANEMIKKFRHFERLELRSNTPRVCLSSLPLDTNNIRTPSNESLANSTTRVTSTSNANPQAPTFASTTFMKKLRELQEEAAVHEVEHKKTVQQHELQRMDFEREMNRKQLMLMDLKIQKAKLKIDILEKDLKNA